MCSAIYVKLYLNHLVGFSAIEVYYHTNLAVRGHFFVPHSPLFFTIGLFFAIFVKRVSLCSALPLCEGLQCGFEKGGGFREMWLTIISVEAT